MITQIELNNLIAKELQFLRDNNVKVFADIGDTVVCVRSHVNQLITCFATTSEEHAVKLVTRCAAYGFAFFSLLGEEISVRPRDPVRSFGTGLIILQKAVQEAELAIARQAMGDARSHLMNILGILAGLMAQFEAKSRPGT